MYGISGDFSNIFGDFLAIYLKTSEIRRKETRSVIDLYLYRFQVFTSALMLFFKQITYEASFHNLFSQPNHERCKISQQCCEIFCILTNRRKLAFVRVGAVRKTAILRSRTTLLLLVVMARGGRDVTPQAANPPIPRPKPVQSPPHNP